VTLSGNDTAVGEIKCVKQFLTVTLVKGVTMEMVYIPPGKFMMGSPATEVGRNEDEGPQREVTISRGFYLGRYEVTQAQWEAVMSTKPWIQGAGTTDNPRYPAGPVSWVTVQSFIRLVNEGAGAGKYRLPTEAEWEYACRADTDTPWSFGSDSSKVGAYAWYAGNSLEPRTLYISGVPFTSYEASAHEVGRKSPNLWGLSDMYGNGAEWVQDWYGPYSADSLVDPSGPVSGEYRVLRGGTVSSSPTNMRSATRGKASTTVPPTGWFSFAFRLLKEY
jgi:formylglycine-generating enzyme required for sulfatase activity